MNYLVTIKDLLSNYKKEKLSSSNVSEKTSALKDLKIKVLQFQSLPPSITNPNEEEFIIAREITELEMELSLFNKNEKNFAIAYLKAKPFYFDYSKNIIKKRSEKFHYYLGLYLLYLLSNNKTTEFSTEIELINKNGLNNEFIKVSRELEQCIVEGNYKQLANLKNANDDNYKYFLNKFDDAIRFEIARSAEMSYDSLKINDAINLLMLNNRNELNNFVNEQNERKDEREIDWKINDERIEFIPLNKEKTTIPSERIIADALLLGIETEKII